MNSSHRSSSATSGGSLNNYEFDFGLAAGKRSAASKPLRGSKPSSSPSPAPSYQAGKPSWTHQPAPFPSSASSRSGLPNPPPSMVGDIFGKSWASSAPSSGFGIPESNPSLFSDLLGPAIGANRNSGNIPLKTAAKISFSTGNLADSLPKTTAATGSANTSKPMKSSWGSAENLGMFSSVGGMGGQPMKSAAGSAGSSMNSKKGGDPFGSLVDFGSKNSKTVPMASSNGGKDSDFGAFHSTSFPEKDDFGAFQDGNPLKSDGFAMPAQSFSASPPPQNPAPSKDAGDPLGMFFSAVAPAAAPTDVSGSQPFSEINDWDLGSEFGGNDAGGGTTTELEGLPPPPPGVSASGAKTKGLDNYKQGQYADAIKWLSWAVALLEKSGDNVSIIEVLSSRASCYKEVGEYKKAVADCSKVLEQDGENVQVLLQRALLYESTEKYRLGAEDLRMVLKIDPGNRLARSTIHRLNKLAD